MSCLPPEAALDKQYRQGHSRSRDPSISLTSDQFSIKPNEEGRDELKFSRTTLTKERRLVGFSPAFTGECWICPVQGYQTKTEVCLHVAARVHVHKCSHHIQAFKFQHHLTSLVTQWLRFSAMAALTKWRSYRWTFVASNPARQLLLHGAHEHIWQNQTCFTFFLMPAFCSDTSQSMSSTQQQKSQISANPQFGHWRAEMRILRQGLPPVNTLQGTWPRSLDADVVRISTPGLSDTLHWVYGVRKLELAVDTSMFARLAKKMGAMPSEDSTTNCPVWAVLILQYDTHLHTSLLRAYKGFCY